MVRVLILNIFLLSAVLIAVNAKNYCASNLCKNGLKHIACGNKGQFAARCPKNARMVSLRRHRRFILNMYNSKRNLIASGRMRRYSPAKRMATMQWNNELARLASLNVKQCRMHHDQCRNTRRFGNSGQNLALMATSGTYNMKQLKSLIRNHINAWWKEYKNANMRIIRRYPGSYSGPPIGHFTVFVAERNVRVGCAASRYNKGGNDHFLMACNYATTNIVGKPIYRRGKAGSGCRTGRNGVFKSLCSKKEKYSGLK